MNLRILRAVLLTGGFLLAVAGGSGFAGWRSIRPAEPQRAIPGGTRVPVLVELFTSEGCSSCPPADRLLSRLVEEQPVEGAEIVALEQHVDYWNRLGWTDPYSSAGYTQRQRQYSDALGLETVYTPQMLVDGQTVLVGSDERRAREAIAAAAHVKKAEVQLARVRDTSRPEALALGVHLAGFSARERADLLLAVTEDKLLSVPSRGENAGHGWGHSSVSRGITLLGEVKPGAAEFSAAASVKFRPEWRRENLRVIAFVQERRSRRVLGVGELTIAKDDTPPPKDPPH